MWWKGRTAWSCSCISDVLPMLVPASWKPFEDPPGVPVAVNNLRLLTLNIHDNQSLKPKSLKGRGEGKISTGQLFFGSGGITCLPIIFTYNNAILTVFLTLRGLHNAVYIVFCKFIRPFPTYVTSGAWEQTQFFETVRTLLMQCERKRERTNS